MCASNKMYPLIMEFIFVWVETWIRESSIKWTSVFETHLYSTMTIRSVVRVKSEYGLNSI